MAPDTLVERLELAATAVLLIVGVVITLASANAVKRVCGLTLVVLAVLVALAAVHAPQAAIMAGVAVAFAQMLIGAAVLVRLQEAYGVIEVAEFDAADAKAEPAEPSA